MSGELTAHLTEVCSEFDHVCLQKSIKSGSRGGGSIYIYILTCHPKEIAVFVPGLEISG